jgi:NAD(P)H-hydrate epimerase
VKALALRALRLLAAADQQFELGFAIATGVFVKRHGISEVRFSIADGCPIVDRMLEPEKVTALTSLGALRRDQVREIDRRAIEIYGMSGLVLMENAGRGCVEVLLSLGCQGPVAIVCGKGNNAGDGFVIARHLLIRGLSAKTILLCPPVELRGDAAANYAILSRSQAPLVDLSQSFSEGALQAELQDAEWIVDAILGTGATGPPRPPCNTAIRVMNASAAQKMAIDLPSGLDCDSGLPADPTFRADHTCTFVTPKVGFGNAAALPFLGQVHVVDIGVPRCVVAEFVRIPSP